MSTRIERAMADAMRAEDPVASLHAAANDPDLAPDLRAALRRVDPDGVRIQALLVIRLRFERLLAACPEAALEFERDPQAFAATFRAYHRAVPMTAFFPSAEARLYRAHVARR